MAMRACWSATGSPHEGDAPARAKRKAGARDTARLPYTRRGNGHRTLTYLYLVLAIVGEVVGTSALKASDGLTRAGPTALTVAAYASAFYLLSLTFRVIPMGVVYAIWSGLGIVLIALIGWLRFRQVLDWPALLGLGLILAGVLVINLFSRSAGRG